MVNLTKAKRFMTDEVGGTTGMPKRTPMENQFHSIVVRKIRAAGGWLSLKELGVCMAVVKRA